MKTFLLLFLGAAAASSVCVKGSENESDSSGAAGGADDPGLDLRRERVYHPRAVLVAQHRAHGERAAAAGATAEVILDEGYPVTWNS